VVTYWLAAKPILDLIKKIGKLSPLLPETVPEAPADDDIHRIITRVEHPDGTVAATFNRYTSATFQSLPRWLTTSSQFQVPVYLLSACSQSHDTSAAKPAPPCTLTPS
jgi:hypothetical protein